MNTIRERDASFARLVAEHLGEAFLCAGVAEDRRALLAAGDALAEAARLLTEFEPGSQEPADAAWVFPRLLDILRDALDRWREVTG
jgi:hypothetical protein